MTTLASALVLLLASAPTPVASQPSSPSELTLSQAMALSEQYRPLLDGARSRVEEIDARRREVAGESLPNVDLQAVRVGGLSGAKGNGLQIAGVVSSQLVRDNAAGVNIRQRIFDSGEVSKRKRALGHQVAAARADGAVSLRQVNLEVVSSFIEVKKQESLLVLAQEVLDQRTAFIAQVQSALKAGLRSEVDVRLARVQQTRARSLVTTAATRRDQAWAMLRRAMGSPPLIPERLAPIGFTSPSQAAGDSSPPSSLTKRPEVIAALEAESAASLETQAIRATRRPLVVGFLSAGMANTSESNQDLEWAGGLAVKLPLDVSRVFHERERQAQLRVAQAKARRAESESLAHLEVEQATSEVRNLQTQVHLAAEEVESARAALTVSDAQYRSGLGSFLDRLSAENVLLEARTRYDVSRFDLFGGCIRLEVARGSSVPDAVATASARAALKK